MNTIRVRICLGTTCFVMGASNLQTLEDELPESLRDRVSVEGVTCLGLCKDGAYGKAPYVTINDEVLPGATVETVIARLAELVGGDA